MTSHKARTALGAGASLALRPTPTAGSYFNSQSDLGSLGESGTSDATGRSRSYNIEEDGVVPIMPETAAPAEGEAGNGSRVSGEADSGGGGDGGGDGGYNLFNFKFSSGVLGGSGSGKGAGGRGSGGAGAAGGGGGGRDTGDMPPPPPRPPSKEAKEGGDPQAALFPDPFQLQQSRRLSGLPENEEVVPDSPRPSLEAAKQVMYGEGRCFEENESCMCCVCSTLFWLVRELL